MFPRSVKSGLSAVWPGRKRSQRAFYDSVSGIGHDSQNAWIRKSAEIPGWLFEGEHEFLWELALRQRDGHVLEIGTWMGKSACILAGSCIEHSPGTCIFCVDTFEMDGTQQQTAYHRQLMRHERGTFYQFLLNAERLGFADVVIPLATCSARALPHLPKGLRMAFVDGTHDYQSARRDVELCLPLLRVGGVLALHDVIGEAYPELSQYVAKELRSDNRLRKVGERGTIVAFEKVKGSQRDVAPT